MAKSKPKTGAAALAASRQQSIQSLNDLFKSVYGGSDLFTGSHTTVDQWMNQRLITQEDLDKYPNARIANELKNSPLAQSLKEEEGVVEENYHDEPTVIMNPKSFNGLLDMLSRDEDFYGAPVHIDLNPPKKKRKNAKLKNE